jgi:hypothetical protein
MAEPVIEFRRSPDADAEIFACGACGRVYTCGAPSHEYATSCCVPRKCRYCDAIVGKGPGGILACVACRERRLYERATKVPARDWPGPVFVDDRFFRDVDELLDCYDGDDEDRPAFAWAAVQVAAPRLDVDVILDGLRDEAPEDWEPEGVEDLRAAVDAWNAIQSSDWWQDDTGTAVVLDWGQVAGEFVATNARCSRTVRRIEDRARQARALAALDSIGRQVGLHGAPPEVVDGTVTRVLGELRSQRNELLEQLTHLREQAGPDSCADYVVRNRALQRERDELVAGVDQLGQERDQLREANRWLSRRLSEVGVALGYPPGEGSSHLVDGIDQLKQRLDQLQARVKTLEGYDG